MSFTVELTPDTSVKIGGADQATNKIGIRVARTLQETLQ